MNNSKSVDQNVLNITIPNKPSTDKKQYRCFSLPNEMKVTIISDPEIDKSAVSMDVRIGSLSDPWDIQGLAHFCEHMVFMGSSKYPEENYYSKYLSQNNGAYNAYTSKENTNYFFSINPDNLLEALDIFSQFFISPLFTESATDREMQAVHSEHEKNICSDFRRRMQLDRFLCDQHHDYSKFPTGNLKTLKEDPEKNNINVRQALLDFHNRFYSSNIMSLCVLGRESLDVLQSSVVEMFHSVENKHVILPTWDTQPWADEHLQQIIYITPIQESYELEILWPIPDYHKFYRSKPEHYVSHLLGHEGKGSVLCLLKRKGWANMMSAGSYHFANGIDAMIITITLFEEGINHIDEIVTIVYQYIHILQSQNPAEWIFQEIKQLDEMKFKFLETSKLESFVSKISQDMRRYDSENILDGPYIMTDFQPDQIMNIINCLRPSRMKLYCSTQKFESKCTNEEYWYKTKYAVENPTKEQIEMWSKVKPNCNLFLPSENKFIASDFTIKSANEDSPSSRPELLRDSTVSRWWWCQDTCYLLPKGFVFIHLINNLASKNPIYSVMDSMIVDMFTDAINEQLYDATLANLSFSFTIDGQGLKLYFYGYNEKMAVFISDIIGKLSTFVPDVAKFDAIKENRFRILRNFFVDQPITQADKLLSCLLTEVMWHNDDLLSTYDDITIENLRDYLKMFFSQLHTEGLVYGNFKCNEAYSIMNDIEMIFAKHFCTRPMLRSQLNCLREVLLPENSNYVLYYTNKKQKTSVLMTYLQSLERNNRNNILMKLCEELFKEPLFNKLRTEEQLGYIVGSAIRTSDSMQGNRIYLQSMKMPTELDERVNNFLTIFKATLEEMSDEEFSKYVIALKTGILEKPKDMMKQASKYWNEISNKHYNFKRDQDEVDELMKLTKIDVIEFYKKCIDPNSKLLKKLSIHVVPEGTCIEKNSSMTIVDDIVRFKKSLPLSPLIDPVLPPAKEVRSAKL